MISNLESWRNRVTKANTQADCDKLEKSLDRLWANGSLTLAEFRAMDDATFLRRVIIDIQALDELGEPFPDVQACIAAGQSPRELARSTRAALEDALMD